MAESGTPLWYEILGQGIAGPPPRWSYGPASSWDFEPDPIEITIWPERLRWLKQQADYDMDRYSQR